MKPNEINESANGLIKSVEDLIEKVENDLESITDNEIRHRHIRIIDALYASRNQLDEAKVPLTECPYCHSAVEVGADHTYHCPNCDSIFDDNDIEREPIRHQISAILFAFGATQENPVEFNHALAFPKVIGLFETQDGIYLNPCDGGEPIAFDDWDTDELKQVLSLLEQDAEREKNRKVTYEVCPFCGKQVMLDAELKVHECPNCGKSIVACSMCEAKDNCGGDNYCKHCCLIYQADRENERAF